MVTYSKLNLLMIIFFTSCYVPESVKRFRRTLIFPPTAPTRTQFICGVGIPLFLDQQSVTTGYVLKAEYFLPTVASEIRPIVIPPPNYTIITTNAKRSLNEINLHDDNVHSSLGNYMMFDDTREVISENKNKFIRWALYKTLEKFAERLGLIGRACVLRTICENAELPFHEHSGIIGEILRIILSPSSSDDPLAEHADNEYIHAENLGKSGASCGNIFKECKLSLLTLITNNM